MISKIKWLSELKVLWFAASFGWAVCYGSLLIRFLLSHLSGSVINCSIFGQGFESEIIMGFRNGFDIMIVNCRHYCSATHCQSNSALKRHFVRSLCSSAPVLLFIQANMHLKHLLFQLLHIHIGEEQTSRLTWRHEGLDISALISDAVGYKIFKLRKYKNMAVSKPMRILDILGTFESLNCFFFSQTQFSSKQSEININHFNIYSVKRNYLLYLYHVCEECGVKYCETCDVWRKLLFFWCYVIFIKAVSINKLCKKALIVCILGHIKLWLWNEHI